MASWQDKIKQAAIQGAIGAVSEERARMLWVMAEFERDTVKNVERLLLVEAQRHLAEIKLKLARAIIGALRISVVAGHRPRDPSELDVFRKAIRSGNGASPDEDSGESKNPES